MDALLELAVLLGIAFAVSAALTLWVLRRVRQVFQRKRSIEQGAKVAELARSPAVTAHVKQACEEARSAEDFGFAEETAMGYGAITIDDDCEVYAMTRESLVGLMFVCGYRHRRGQA